MQHDTVELPALRLPDVLVTDASNAREQVTVETHLRTGRRVVTVRHADGFRFRSECGRGTVAEHWSTVRYYRNRKPRHRPA
jgi:hypothetical protein